MTDIITDVEAYRLLLRQLGEAQDEIERLRAALQSLMNQPTMSPLEMTPDQRKELWATHEKARAALEPKSSRNKP
jgi:hypothetical protein